MADPKSAPPKQILDKDLDKIGLMESAVHFVLGRTMAPGFALLFIVAAGLATITMATGSRDILFVVAAAVVAAYMAMNIGANDVTNNVGAAVGSKAISMASALVIAAVCEIAGAYVAGDRVVATIKTGILHTAAMPSSEQIMVIMVSALFSAALWINIATWLNAPVSTTHSIIGSIMGAGAVIAGPAAVNWGQMAEVTAGWLISPLIGGLIAVLFLWFIQSAILYASDRLLAAQRWVPFLLAVMLGAFASYIMLTVFRGNPDVTLTRSLTLGVCVAGLGYALFRRLVDRQAARLDPLDPSIKTLFRMPLVFSAALLSFAHGANDVSNAIGPLSAVVEAAGIQTIASNSDAPLWVMSIGALGISIGLVLFGPRLIRIVGSQITKLNPIRAYCVAISAAVTVIIASAFGLPVSSTHIAVGSVFGVGLFREWYTANSSRRQAYIQAKAGPTLTASLGDHRPRPAPAQAGRPVVDNSYRYLVRRSYLLSILAAWVVTVPASGLMGAGIALTINAIRH